MPDIQFADLRDGGDGVNIVEMQAMPGMHPQARIHGHTDGFQYPREFLVPQLVITSYSIHYTKLYEDLETLRHRRVALTIGRVFQHHVLNFSDTLFIYAGPAVG